MFVDRETGARQFGRVLTEDELRAETRDGRVVTIIGVTVPDIVEHVGGGDWIGLLCAWVTGVRDGLADVEYRAVGYSADGDLGWRFDEVKIEVSGVVQWHNLAAATPVIPPGKAERRLRDELDRVSRAHREEDTEEEIESLQQALRVALGRWPGVPVPSFLE